MMKLTVYLCAILVVADALQISRTRSYLGKERRLQQTNETNGIDQNVINSMNKTEFQIFTAGFLRTDTFDWLRDVWIQAQVLPVGVCFKEGSKGGSAMIAQLAIDSSSVLRTSNVYASGDCTGSFDSIPYLESIVTTDNQLEIVLSHIEDLDTALELIPSYHDGMIIT